MARKIRMTPFARFFIFLLFAAPLAFLGASYYRGEDGFAKIKSILDQLKGETQINEDGANDTLTFESNTTNSDNNQALLEDKSDVYGDESYVNPNSVTKEVVQQSDIDKIKNVLDTVLLNQKIIIELLKTKELDKPLVNQDTL